MLLSNKQANKKAMSWERQRRHSSDEQGADSRAKQFYRMVQIRSSRLCCNLQVWCRGSMSLFYDSSRALLGAKLQT